MACKVRSQKEEQEEVRLSMDFPAVDPVPVETGKLKTPA